MRRALRSLGLAFLVVGCGESSLGALRSPDAGWVDVSGDPGADGARPRLLSLRCGGAFPDAIDEVGAVSGEVRVRLRDDRDLAVVERWIGGDSLLDGDDVNLLLPGGSCEGGAAFVGFREGLRAGEAASGSGCLPGMTTISTIELGYNGNFRGACVHGGSADGGRSRALRLRNDYWRPDEVIELARGEARCAFGVQYSSVVSVAPDGARWSRILDEDYLPQGLPVSLDEYALRLRPWTALTAASERWALWTTADSRWFAERMQFSGGTQKLQGLQDVLGGLDASFVLDAQAVAPGLLAVVRSPHGLDGTVGGMLVCPDEPAHVRRLIAADAVAARLVERGDGLAMVWQTDDPDGLARLWVAEFDGDFLTRTPPQLIEEGAGVTLVELTTTSSPSELVLWSARRRADGTAMLRVGRLVFGF